MLHMITGFFALLLCCAAADNITWIEAEEFKGNAVATAMPDASGGKALAGNTWYEFIKNMPAPVSGGAKLHCFIRMKSDVPANWFLCYQTSKVERWMKTTKNNQWEWVSTGEWRAEHVQKHANMFPRLFLQNPQKGGQGAARGFVDVIVFTDNRDTARLDALLAQRCSADKATPANDMATEARKNLRRAFSCPELSAAPKLDGDLADPVWREAAQLTDFSLLRGRGVASQQTTVKIGRHGDWLYIGGELRERGIPFLRKLQTQNGGQVWNDDCLELFFDPGLTQKRTLQLSVNPNGAKFDTLKSRLDEPDFAEVKLREWQTATRIYPDRWTVEIAIPWRLLAARIPAADDVWGVNFCRNEVPSQEQSAWCDTGDIFNQPDRFGLMFFQPLPGGFAGVKFDSGTGRLGYSFGDVSGKPLNLAVRVTRDGATLFAKNTAVTTARHTPFELGKLKSGKYKLNTKIGDSLAFSMDIPVFSDGLVSLAYPQSARENTLFLLDGTAGHSFFIPANHGAKRLESLALTVRVPRGVRILPAERTTPSGRYIGVTGFASRQITRDGAPYTEYRFTLEGTLPPGNIRDRAFYQGVLLFFRSEDRTLSGQTRRAWYNFSEKISDEPENEFALNILPATQGKQPTRLAIHNWLWTYNPYRGETADAFIGTLAKVGFNGVDADGTVELEQYQRLFRQNGLKPVNNLHYYWYFDRHLKQNPADGAVNPAGTVSKKNVCPTILLAGEGKLLKASLAAIFDRVDRKQSQGIIWDLEGPHVFDLCFCTRCLAAFAAANGLDGKSLSPQFVRSNYAGPWTKFACAQSAAMCRILRAELKRRDPAAMLGIYCALPNPATMENYRVDWTQTLPHLDLALLSYYSGSATALDDTFNGQMRAHIAALRGLAGKRPLKIWATLTPGYGPHSAMEPTAELVKMQVLRSFASGADGVSFWWWGPFDGKYYRELAEASRIVADFEAYFLAGDNPAAAKVTHKYGSRVSSFASKVGDRTMVMIMNHQAAHAADVEISVPGATKLAVYQGEAKLDGARAALRVPALGAAVITAE